MITLKGVTKIFQTKERSFTALNNINLTIEKGEYVAIVGKSGSGKSTLLNMISGIDHPTEGIIRLNDTDIGHMNESELAAWRGRNIGIVFQFFQLITTLTILENILFAMELVNTIPKAESMNRANDLLQRVGIPEQSRFQLFRIYISMLLVIGALSGLIAIPASLLSGWAFAHFVAGKLNFNIITTTLPLSVYITMILASLLMPVLLSLSIVLKGTGISVREALSDYGIAQKAVGREYPWLKALHLSDRMMLAFRNSQRNKSRLMVTVFAVAFGVAIFSTGFNVRQS